jgi:hypothetical protein
MIMAILMNVTLPSSSASISIRPKLFDFKGIGESRVAEEADYFGMESLVRMLKGREDEDEKAKKKISLQPDKRVLVYSIEMGRATFR